MIDFGTQKCEYVYNIGLRCVHVFSDDDLYSNRSDSVKTSVLKLFFSLVYLDWGSYKYARGLLFISIIIYYGFQ